MAITRPRATADIAEDVSVTFDILSPPGTQIVTRFLKRSTGVDWHDRLKHVLISVKRLCDVVEPPKSQAVGGGIQKKVPRSLDPADIPTIRADYGGDALIATFTGGVFRDSLVPVVRTWVEQQAVSSPAQLKSFVECFAAISHAGFAEQERKKASATLTSSMRLSRNASTRVAKRASSVLQPSSVSSAASSTSLVQILYGAELAATAPFSKINDPAWLAGLHQYYLLSSDPPDPKGTGGDQQQ